MFDIPGVFPYNMEVNKPDGFTTPLKLKCLSKFPRKACPPTLGNK
jgi:hypothetical protein